MKRAHLSAVAFGREVLVKVAGMTPARFDLLYLLRRAGIVTGCRPLAAGRWQKGLWKDLGLHRTTVSRMLRRLEDMGWIRRKVCPDDRRTRDVMLTELGLRRIWKAMRRVFRPRIFRRIYEKLLRSMQPKGSTVHTLTLVRNMIRTTSEIARRFGDTSRVWFDFGGGVPRWELPPDYAARPWAP